MGKKIFNPKQILAKLRQIEVTVAQGKSVLVARKECHDWGMTAFGR